MAMYKINYFKLYKQVSNKKSYRFSLFFKPSLNVSSVANKSFKFKDIQIHMCTEAQKMDKPLPYMKTFGDTYTDHMFEVKWSEENGWGIPQIVPFHQFHMHPGSRVLHYGISVFEGMKAFRSSHGTISLFRPEMYIRRMVVAAKRATLPYFEAGEFLQCLTKLISIEKDWVPNRFDTSLYIRSTFIGGKEASLGLEIPKSALLYIITSPVEGYFQPGLIHGISLLAEPEYVRSWPGHVGDMKMGSNYAPTFYVQNLADELGFHDFLWLRKSDNIITQATVTNVFFLLQKGENKFELATPKLDGTVIPGVIRQSLLQLAYQLQEVDVSERDITMDEIINCADEKSLLEMFVCGTATGICPVKLVRFINKDIRIPTLKSQRCVYRRLHKALTDIQYQKVASDWSVEVS